MWWSDLTATACVSKAEPKEHEQMEPLKLILDPLKYFKKV